MRKSSLVGLGALLLANACGLLFPIPDGSESPDAGIGVANSDGSTDVSTLEDGGDAAAPPIHCSADVREPKLVAVDTYCVDRTEVTMAQYEAFLDAGVPLDAMAPGCEAKVAYGFSPLPDGGKPAADTAALVDWCEADVYCRWAGKHLCGAIDGGTLRFENSLQPDAGNPDRPRIGDREQNAWLHACTGPTGSIYPYGNDFEPDACVPGRPVGQPECQGGYPGISDFTTNMEWVDSCEDKGCMFMASPCRNYGSSLKVEKHDSFGSGSGIRCCWP
jgi:hypothetical protein